MEILFLCQNSLALHSPKKRNPSHFEYSDTVIKYAINELMANEELLKVLVQSNYWKKYGSIEILAVFTKYVVKIEDEVTGTSLNN